MNKGKSTTETPRPYQPARPKRGQRNGDRLSWEETPRLKAALEVVWDMLGGASGVAELLNCSESFARDLRAGETPIRADQREVILWAQLRSAEELRAVKLEPAPAPEPEAAGELFQRSRIDELEQQSGDVLRVLSVLSQAIGRAQESAEDRLKAMEVQLERQAGALRLLLEGAPLPVNRLRTIDATTTSSNSNGNGNGVS